MAITKLDVVNAMLGGLGERPVNSLTDGHPLVPSALSILATASTREQGKSWWFNRELVELTPDTSGFIWLPNDALSVDPQAKSLNYVVRGRKLYKPLEKSLANKYKFDQAVTIWLIREVPFDDCPVSAQMLISYAAQLDFCDTYNPDPAKIALLEKKYARAAITVGSENITAYDFNLFNRSGIARNPLTSSGGNMERVSTYYPHK